MREAFGRHAQPAEAADDLRRMLEARFEQQDIARSLILGQLADVALPLRPAEVTSDNRDLPLGDGERQPGEQRARTQPTAST